MAEENSEAGDIVTCPTCMKIWPKGTKFCTQCGTWIESGQVMDEEPKQPLPVPPPPGAGGGVPAQGQSPPGIKPRSLGGVPSAPPRTAASFADRPAGDASVAPQTGPEAGQPAEPQKRYRFQVEPAREERLPTSPVFIPKREVRKSSGPSPGQVLLIIISLLGIAYAVISIAFKPLHGFLVGTVFETIGKPDTAVQQYQKAVGSDSFVAGPAAKAMTRAGKGVFTRHIELQYDSSWTATSMITLTVPSRQQPYQFQSTIEYTAPGQVREQISGEGRSGGRAITPEGYLHQFGGSNLRRNAAQYASDMERVLGFDPDTFFSSSGKKKVVDAFFDKLGMQLEGATGKGEYRAYRFVIAPENPSEAIGALAEISGPFFPWVSLTVVGNLYTQVAFTIRADDGFLTQIEYLDTNGKTILLQSFDKIEEDGD